MIKFDTGYAENRARISVALSQFTVPLLSKIYKAFDGDVVAAIVLGEVAHRNVLAWLADREHSEEPLYDAAQRLKVMRPCNALSIADVCDIPRETVRRKVVLLIEKGYIFRNEEGHLFLTETVGESFEDTTAEIVEHLLATARRLEELLARQRSGIGPLRLD